MKSRAVSLEGGKIVGKLNQPKTTKRLILVCHGYQDSQANPTLVAISEMLNHKGHTTLTFNFSPNKGGIDIEQQVRDILYIVDYYQEFEDIIVLAASFAALSASIAAIQSARIKGLITVSGFFGTSELGSSYRQTYLKFRVASLMIPRFGKIYRYYKRELRPELIKVPTLVIHSKVDKEVFFTQSQRFYAQLTAPKHFVALQTAAHGIPLDKDRRYCVKEIDTWLTVTAQLRKR